MNTEHPHRTGQRRIILLTLLIVMLSFAIELCVWFDVRLNQFEDGSGSISWCTPHALCDSERNVQ